MLRIALATSAIVTLAACTGTDGERATAGALTAATAAAITDNNVATAAAAGAAAGALCDEAGVCEDG
ncbi:hypothetical protein [Pseudaestuariivita sp.]|uniref:hypothetical protein n=1 Tax=Pseudaestuariivita sp. TaxID=2211669 RepID=UPI004058FC37